MMDGWMFKKKKVIYSEGAGGGAMDGWKVLILKTVSFMLPYGIVMQDF